VDLDDGTVLQLLFKDLNWQALPPHVRQVKPAFLYDPLREIEVYRTILAPLRLGTAICYGAEARGGQGETKNRGWLFLEKVTGLEMYQVGQFEIWAQVARWLAGLHTRFADLPDLAVRAASAHLLVYNAAYYRVWMRRAAEFLSVRIEKSTAASEVRGIKELLQWLANRHEWVVERLAALPATFIHGEFYASNILVQKTEPSESCGDFGSVPVSGSLRICPVDWEMAGLGPGLIDLAALISGKWTAEQKRALALEYYAALPPTGAWAAGPDDFLAALDWCRLHNAVQWLGWSPDWSPPPEQAWNWWEEALELAEKIGSP
jgi:thiamine kinase-like enzyme